MNQNQHILHFGKEFDLHTCTLNGSSIMTTDCIKDLGIILFLLKDIAILEQI